MRMKPEHYDMLNRGIAAFLDAHPEIDIKKALETTRGRWDIYWASKGSFTNAQEFQYLTDNHIDTALKSILKDRIARKGFAVRSAAETPGANRKYQRGPDGYPVNADQLMREAWGRIPSEGQLFWSDKGFQKPVKIYGWRYAPEYGRWRAYVQFPDGTDIWTDPRLVKKF
jgi:hypothetical protein